MKSRRQAELQLELGATEGCLLAVEATNRRSLSQTLFKQKCKKEAEAFPQQRPMVFTSRCLHSLRMGAGVAHQRGRWMGSFDEI